MEYMINEFKKMMLILEGFRFLNYKEKKTYEAKKHSTKNAAKKEIHKYIIFLSDNFIKPFLMNYDLKLSDLVIDCNDSSRELDLRIAKPDSVNEFDYKFKIYRNKEETNLSDLSYIRFKTYESRFPNIQFIKDCQLGKTHLDLFTTLRNELNIILEYLRVKWYLKRNQFIFA